MPPEEARAREEASQAVRALFERLLARGLTLAAAESCTGGLFCGLLTDFPGSSAALIEGRVVYSNAAKERLGVPARLIERQGAVSAEVAASLAAKVRETAGADLGVAVSGVAGPGGGTARKPVGTVAFAVSGPGALEWSSLELLPGGRSAVRWESCRRLALAAARALDDDDDRSTGAQF